MFRVHDPGCFPDLPCALNYITVVVERKNIWHLQFGLANDLVDQHLKVSAIRRCHNMHRARCSTGGAIARFALLKIIGIGHASINKL